MAYNGNGQLSGVTDPAGRTLTLSYTGGFVSSTSDPAGRSVQYGYNDGNNNLTDVTDLNGHGWHFAYSANHLLTVITDPRGNTTTNHYDAQNRVDWQLDRRGNTTYFQYTGAPLTQAGGSTVVIDRTGNQVQYQYQNGLKVAETKGYQTASAATWTYTYDPATLAQTTVTDPNGNVTTNVVDGEGHPVSSSDGLGRQTLRTWDALGDLTSSQDPLQVVTTNAYDSQGNIQSTSTPLNATQSRSVLYHYDGGHPGDVTSMTDPDSKVWQYQYDGAGNRTSVIDPLNEKTTSCFDGAGRATSVISPRGTGSGITCASAAPAAFTSYRTYDPAGDVLTVQDALQHRTVNTFDENRNLLQTTDPELNVTRYHYDQNDEKDQVTTGLGTSQPITTKTDYNKDGTIKDQVDGMSQTTLYGYDPLARVTSTTDPVHPHTTYTYDGSGNRRTMVDAQNQTTTYGYDAANELTSITYSDGVTKPVTYAYDLDGHRSQMTDGTGTTTYGLDALHRLTQETTQPPTGPSKQVQYAYDLRGHVVSITYPDGAGQVTRVYDDAGRLHTVSDWQQNTTTFNFDGDSNLTSQQYPSANGTVATFTRNDAGQLTGVSDTTRGNNFLNLSYTRDKNGMLKSEAPTNYAYDPSLRLTASGGSSYGYDAADNLTQQASGVTQAYDNADELTMTTQPIQLVGHGHMVTNNAPMTVPLNTTAAKDDEIVVGVTSSSGAAFSLPACYQQVPSSPVTSTGTIAATSAVYVCKASGGESSVVVNKTGNLPVAMQAVAMVYRGVDPNSAVQTATNGSSSNGTVAPASITTAVNGEELVLFQGAQGNAQSGSWSSGNSTEQDQITPQALGGAAMADRSVPTAGAAAISGTFSRGSSAAGIMLALKPQLTNFVFDARGNRRSQTDAFNRTTTYSYDQANRMTSFNGTSATYTYNGDGLRSSKTLSGGAAAGFIWDEAEGLPQLLADGTNYYIYGVGGRPLQQIAKVPQPIQLVGHGHMVTNNAPMTVPLNTTAAKDDEIVVGVTSSSGAAFSLPACYQQVPSSPVTSTGTIAATSAVYVCKASGGESSVVVDKTGNLPVAMQAVAMVYRGVDPNGAVQTATNGSSSNGTVAPASIMTTVNGEELVLFQGAQGNAQSGSWSSSNSTEQDQITPQALGGAAMADKAVATAGANAISGTFSRSSSAAGIMLALKPNPTTSFFHQDQLGSTRALTDPNGNVVGTYQFDPYGNTIANNGRVTTPLLYAGQYQDPESGLYYLRARYYDPGTGQFLSRDPAVSSTRQPYAYVGDDPLNRTDPTGVYGDEGERNLVDHDPWGSQQVRDYVQTLPSVALYGFACGAQSALVWISAGTWMIALRLAGSTGGCAQFAMSAYLSSLKQSAMDDCLADAIRRQFNWRF